jgi:hypothetical protein
LDFNEEEFKGKLATAGDWMIVFTVLSVLF